MNETSKLQPPFLPPQPTFYKNISSIIFILHTMEKLLFKFLISDKIHVFHTYIFGYIKYMFKQMNDIEIFKCCM